MLFKKLKMGIWFLCGFAIILLFCSLPLKHFADNSVIAITAGAISLVLIPLYTYYRRRKNFMLIREYRSVKYLETDSHFDKFKKSLYRTHFKAEAIAAAIYCAVGAFAFSYYFSKNEEMKGVTLISVLCSIGLYGLIMLIDFMIWGRTVAYYERPKSPKQGYDLTRNR